MSTPAEQLSMTAEEFLTWEESQEEKHEFLQGEIFAMGGARREHVVACLNIASHLKQQLRNTPCRAYMSDMKLQIEQLDAYYYPDVMVSCSQPDQQAEQFLTQPRLILEILSDSTEAYDRGDKFAAYRKIESLQEYVLIDIKHKRVECFNRTENNDWLLHDYSNETSCTFSSLELTISLDAVFEDIA